MLFRVKNYREWLFGMLTNSQWLTVETDLSMELFLCGGFTAKSPMGVEIENVTSTIERAKRPLRRHPAVTVNWLLPCTNVRWNFFWPKLGQTSLRTGECVRCRAQPWPMPSPLPLLITAVEFAVSIPFSNLINNSLTIANWLGNVHILHHAFRAEGGGVRVCVTKCDKGGRGYD